MTVYVYVSFPVGILHNICILQLLKMLYTIPSIITSRRPIIEVDTDSYSH